MEPGIRKSLLAVAAGKMEGGVTDSLATVLGSISEVRRMDRKRMPRPAVYLGYSVGIFTAMFAAGKISEENLLRLVIQRGRFLDQCSRQKQGGMVVVMGLSDNKIRQLARAKGFRRIRVYLCNHNAPGHWTLAGERRGLRKAMAWLEEAGARRLVILKARGAWHSPLMRGAARPFLQWLRQNQTIFQAGSSPVLDNLDGRTLPVSGACLHARLVRQLYSGVNWLACLRHAKKMGVKQFIEIGFTDILKKMGPFVVPTARHYASALDL